MSSGESEHGRAGPSAALSANDAANKKRKIQRACDLCRRKKVRCDGAQTDKNVCSNCAALGIECTYISEAKKRGPPKGYVESLEKRLEKMEDLLQKLAPGVDIEAELQQAAESSAPSPAAGGSDDKQKQSPAPGTLNDDNGDVTLMRDYARAKTHTCKPVSMQELGDDYDTSDDDMGPDNLPDLITDAMRDLSLGDTHLTRFHGKSSSLVLIRAATDLKKEHGVAPGGGARRAEFWAPSDWEWDLLQDAGAPSSVAFPPEDLTATLFDLFFRNFTPFLPIIHEPSFRAQFAEGLHLTNTSFAIVVLLVCSIASRYSNDSRVYLKDAGPPSAGWKYFVQVKDLKRSIHAPAKLSDLQTYALVAYYLQATSAPHSAWTVIGIGIRCAQDIGVHRKKVYKGTISLQEEQWKRVFWCLITLDRYVSSALGRPLACQDEDFDIDFPEEIDDEYWMPPSTPKSAAASIADSSFYEGATAAGAREGSKEGSPMNDVSEWVPKQPDNMPSKISYFVAYLKLGQILAFALRTIYTINKSKVLLGFVGPQWEQHIVAELDSAMNKWLDAVPDHLRWDPNRENQMHFEQSAVLYAAYYHLHILIHRPFIPSPKKPSVLSFPSLTICTNAARSCSHVIESYGKRSLHVPPSTLIAAFTSGVILLISIWGAKKTGLNVDYKAQMKDVDKCLHFLQKSETDWHYSGRLVDILRELASFGEVQLKNASSHPTNKRDRDQDALTNSNNATESSAIVDDASRPRKPIPRAKGTAPIQSGSRQGGSTLPTSSSSASLSSLNQGRSPNDSPLDGSGSYPSQHPLPSPNYITGAANAAGINPETNPFEWNPSMVGAAANAGIPRGVGMAGMGLGGMGGYNMMMNGYGGMAPPGVGGMMPPGGMNGLGWLGANGNGLPPGQGYPDPMAGIHGMSDMFLPNFFAAAAVSNGTGYSIPSMGPYGPGGGAPISPDTNSSPGSNGMGPQQSPGAGPVPGSGSSHWGGIISTVQQPYNPAFHRTTAAAVPAPSGDELFAPFTAYQGAGGTLALASEAQAILGGGNRPGETGVGNGNSSWPGDWDFSSAGASGDANEAQEPAASSLYQHPSAANSRNGNWSY